jgi:hypothetical protein
MMLARQLPYFNIMTLTLNPLNVGSTRVGGTACRDPLGHAVGALEIPTGQSVVLGGSRPRSLLVRRLFPRLESLGWPSVPHP